MKSNKISKAAAIILIIILLGIFIITLVAALIGNHKLLTVMICLDIFVPICTYAFIAIPSHIRNMNDKTDDDKTTV